MVNVLKRLLRRVLLLFVHLYGASKVRAATRQVQQFAGTQPRILLVRPDYLGDLILTTPVLNALKTAAPDAHITMMVGPWSKEVVERHPAVDQLQLCPFPGVRGAHKSSLRPLLLLRVATYLRREHYDLAINFRLKSWWISALLYLAGIPRRIGYATSLSTSFLTHALSARSHEHLSVASLSLLSAGLQSLGYPPLAEPYTPERYPSYFKPTTDERQWVMQRLRRERIDPEALLVVIHPGAGAAVKQWRSDAWGYCATRLSQTLGGTNAVHFLLTGTASEQSLLEGIERATNARTTMITGMTIGQLAAVLQQAQLVLGVDSGPLHLATALAIPTARIYGPIDPRIFGPWGNQVQHTVITSTHRCATCTAIPCGHLSFPAHELGLHPCVKLVPEQQVLEAIVQHFPRLSYNNSLSLYN
jgi:ADP-heptose:LPS heptosyltransferase